MHYYQFNIGDYIKHTSHLTPMEDITYRRLLDLYYDTESPITQNNPVVSRRLRVPEECVEIILNEFFTLTENGWVNARADAEIAAYHAYNEKQKANGIKGGRPKKTQNNPSLTQAEPKITLNRNHKPETINQEREEKATPDGDSGKKPVSPKASRIDPNWQPDEVLMAWAKAERSDLHLATTIASFRDYWIGKSGKDATKADWSATFRNWVRREKGNAPQQSRAVDTWAGRDF